jgi:hypothetical protein
VSVNDESAGIIAQVVYQATLDISAAMFRSRRARLGQKWSGAATCKVALEVYGPIGEGVEVRLEVIHINLRIRRADDEGKDFGSAGLKVRVEMPTGGEF